MNKAIGFKPTETEQAYFQKRLAETHKTASAFLHQIIKAYMAFEQEGFLDAEGNKATVKAIQELKTAEQIKTEEIIKREAAKQETERLKLENLKKKNAITPYRGPRVDWGSALGDVGLGDTDDGFRE